MSTEGPPKHERHTWWIVGVVALLLVAISIPIIGFWFRPLELRIDLSNGTTNSIAWACDFDGEHRSGTTNLPVTLVFKAHKVNFSAKPAVPSPPLVMHFQWEYYIHANHTITGAPAKGREGVRIWGTGANWTTCDSL